MFDGLKSQLLVSADLLLRHPRLSFPLLVEEQTGAVLSKFHRTATDRKLTFTLIPNRDNSGQVAPGYRVELNGSIHKYHNNGQHNADQFTAADLLTALIELVETYGIDPYTSILNNLEFGVNVSLPFPVARVLDNLICYKGRRFHPDREHGPYYWQCLFGQYAVKIYDKGAEFRERVPGLPPNLLRVEVKVLKMEFLHKKSIGIKTLADLLAVAHYGTLGALLVETFQDILFDEPTINPALLKPKDRERYQTGRNPRYWQERTDQLKQIDRTATNGKKNYDAARRKLYDDETRFRALLDQHRAGNGNWQNQIAGFIGQTWAQLTTVTPELATAIINQLAAWQSVEKTHKLTGLLDGAGNRETLATEGKKTHKLTGLVEQPEPGKISQIDPLHLVSKCEITNEPTAPKTSTRETQKTTVTYCAVTGIDISHQPSRTRYLSATTIQGFYNTAPQTFKELASRYLSPKKHNTDLAQQCYYIAHNIRNTDTNARNHLRQRVKKKTEVKPGQTVQMFSTKDQFLIAE